MKVAFVYDYMGRRVQKKVWTWDRQAGQAGAWALTGHRKFVWNGWLLLMELDGLNDDAMLRKRTWGLDLSGLMGGGASAGLASGRSTLAGAGGIGGLLAVYDTNGTTTGENPEADDMAYVYFYDANGNVGQVCDLSHTPGDPAGAIVARYEYDPYGNVTSQSGAYAAANPFRFSTKYWDDETGLGYWGYRYYDPKLGRWVNRDPVGERGGENLYAYVVNHPTGLIDAFGHVPAACGPCNKARVWAVCTETSYSALLCYHYERNPVTGQREQVYTWGTKRTVSEWRCDPCEPAKGSIVTAYAWRVANTRTTWRCPGTGLPVTPGLGPGSKDSTIPLGPLPPTTVVVNPGPHEGP